MMQPDYMGAFLSAAAAHRGAEARCAELGSELDRLREAAQAVVDAEGPTQGERRDFWSAVDALRAVLESNGAADHPAATENER